MKLAETMNTSLKHLAVIRNFNEKSAKIDDEAIEALSTCCPNLEHLEIVYSRKFDDKICRHLGNGNVRNLKLLDLSYCPIQCSMEPLIAGCPQLYELKLAGDSFIRKLVLQSITHLPSLRIFHLGHFDHSDVECQKVIPKDPVFSGYSTKGIVVAQTFEDENNFKNLITLYLERYCDLTPFLAEMIQHRYRPGLQIRYNENMSALNQHVDQMENMSLGSNDVDCNDSEDFDAL